MARAPSGTAAARRSPTRPPPRRRRGAPEERPPAPSLSPGPCGNPNQSGPLDPGQVEREKNATAEVSQRVTGGRDPVDLSGAGDVRKQRFIEDEAPGHPYQRQRKEHRGKVQVAGDE